MELESATNSPEKAPEDKYHLFSILTFLVGFMHFVPVSFFVTANEFWMYKFRDVNANGTVAAEDRTFLQANFSSFTSISTIIPMSLGASLTTIFGYKFRMYTRLLTLFFTMSFFFVIGTIFVEINTDSFQITFFVITMLIIAIISFANGSTGVNLIGTLSNFPYKFTRIYIIGEGFSGIIIALLQIISIAIGTTVESSALIYFITGSLILIGTTIFYCFAVRLNFYRYYMNSNSGNAKPTKRHTWKEYKTVFGSIKHCIIVMLFYALTDVLVHPSVTSLVVSEFYGLNDWGTYYFVPVITFLLSTLMDISGRTFGHFFYNINEILLTILCGLRLFIFVPLFWLCNAQPRSHLPVVFHEDYQYIILVVAYQLTSGYIFSMCYYLVQRNVEPDKLELGYGLLTSIITVAGSIFAPLSILAVNVI